MSNFQVLGEQLNRDEMATLGLYLILQQIPTSTKLSFAEKCHVMFDQHAHE